MNCIFIRHSSCRKSNLLKTTVDIICDGFSHQILSLLWSVIRNWWKKQHICEAFAVGNFIRFLLKLLEDWVLIYFKQKNVWLDFKIFVLIVETKFSCCLTKPRPKQSSIKLNLSSENLSFMNNVKRAESFGGRTLNQIDPLLGKSMRPIDCIKHFFDCKKPALIWIQIIVFSSLSATYQRSFNLSMKMSKIRILINFLMADWCWCMFSNVNY